MEYVERILRAGGGAIDAVLCGDDFGTQRGLLIWPRSFDSIFAPRKKEFFDIVHSYGAKVTHHCCGSSRDLMPRFVLVDVVGKDGGYIMSPSHHTQPDTPLDNVLAFYEAAPADRRR